MSVDAHPTVTAFVEEFVAGETPEPTGFSDIWDVYYEFCGGTPRDSPRLRQPWEIGEADHDGVPRVDFKRHFIAALPDDTERDGDAFFVEVTERAD